MERERRAFYRAATVGPDQTRALEPFSRGLARRRSKSRETFGNAAALLLRGSENGSS
jgi:hypothetical protein